MLSTIELKAKITNAYKTITSDKKKKENEKMKNNCRAPVYIFPNI